MLTVLSPAKSLDYESPLATSKSSEPRLLDQASELVEVLAKKSPRSLKQMMGISSDLAELNHERFQEWEVPFPEGSARPSILAFNGDVYLGLDVGSFNQRDFTYSQKVLRILSGLYGVLRPLDLMMPYRLEMGSKLKTRKGKDLYSFWGSTITDVLNADLAASPGEKVLVNLASNEYFKSVRPGELDAPVVSPAFLDAKGDGDFRTVSFFAKKARGSMAAWLVRERITDVDQLPKFDGMGYAHDADRSTDERPVFTRRNPA
ncbi:MAG: peroxide stress protein YaaA [Acidimicrobiia bacterium]|nr:peroxide stress protein YaaA [Acidimicrobiia bacterium]